MYKHKVLLFGFVTLLLSGCGNVGESTSLIKNDEIIIHGETVCPIVLRLWLAFFRESLMK